MISCDLMGGLGNQLFQIFATISYAMQCKQPFIFLDKKTLGNRPTYWNNFFIYLKNFLINKYPTSPKMKTLSEVGFHYEELPLVNSFSNTLLSGYFQSYKYFENNKETICKLIRLDLQKNAIKNKYIHNYDNLVSMHFRLGDYKHLQNFHPVLKFEYYKNSLQHIMDMEKTETETNNKNINLKVLYFCEKDDYETVIQTIDKLQNMFPSCSFIKVSDDIEDWEQMLMMSLCRHNIIANSSFSWWGAYFNTHEDKIICYPSVWFGPALASHDTRDLFPEDGHWNKILCSDLK